MRYMGVETKKLLIGVKKMACTGLYIDAGTNIGWQVEKLYNPSCASPVQPLFDLLGSRSSACSVMIEPNRKHSFALESLVRRFPGRITYLQALASTENSSGTFYTNQFYMDGAHHSDWTGSEIKRHEDQKGIDVPKIDIMNLINSFPSRNIGIKLDIEGSEEWVLPHLEKHDALCRIKFLYAEAHNEKTRAILSDSIRRHHRRRCPVQIKAIDDEIKCHEIKNDTASFCVYVFATNTSVGQVRYKRLKTHLDKENINYRFVTASTYPLWWSVPCLNQQGYVGMWLSMLNIWKHAMKECTSEWVVILESDAVVPKGFNRILSSTLPKDVDVVWLDNRNGYGDGPSGCCTVAVAYRRSILSRLIHHFDPWNSRAYWNGYESKIKQVVNHNACLTDWYLGNLVAHLGLRAKRNGIVHHPISDSEIKLLG